MQHVDMLHGGDGAEQRPMARRKRPLAQNEPLMMVQDPLKSMHQRHRAALLLRIDTHALDHRADIVERRAGVEDRAVDPGLGVGRAGAEQGFRLAADAQRLGQVAVHARNQPHEDEAIGVDVFQAQAELGELEGRGDGGEDGAADGGEGIGHGGNRLRLAGLEHGRWLW